MCEARLALAGEGIDLGLAEPRDCGLPRGGGSVLIIAVSAVVTIMSSMNGWWAWALGFA
jgi:hypothetical protein